MPRVSQATARADGALYRSAGVDFGDAGPILNPAFEHKAGFVHGFALLVVTFLHYEVGP